MIKEGRQYSKKVKHPFVMMMVILVSLGRRLFSTSKKAFPERPNRQSRPTRSKRKIVHVFSVEHAGARACCPQDSLAEEAATTMAPKVQKGGTNAQRRYRS